MSSTDAPSPVGVFYISTTIACIGFLLLFAQTVLATQRDWADINSPEASAAMKRDEESQKTTQPRSKSPVTWDTNSASEPDTDSDEESEADSKEAATKRLHAKMAALNSRLTAPKEIDTTLEILNAVCAYLSTAELLLRARRRGRTDTQLNSGAGALVEGTTQETAPLAKLSHLGHNIGADRRLSAYVALVVGTVSLIAVWTAVATYAATAKQEPLGTEGDYTYLGISFKGQIWTPIGAAGAVASYRTLLALVIPAVLQAAVLHSSSDVVSEDGLLKMTFTYPGTIALSCLMYALLLLDIRPEVLSIGMISSFALMIMTVVAVAASMTTCD